MKNKTFKFKVTLILSLTYLFISSSIFAQSPQKLSYQAVIRNTSGQLVVNQLIGIKISILQGSASGSVVYTETLTPTSNANGLVSLEIGSGAGFNTINWANGPFYIKTETDPTGGANYTIIGTSQLMSVPYALNAKTAETADYNSLTNLPTLSIANWNTAYGWGSHSGLYRPITWVPAWSNITSTPTTIAGYGITNAMTTSHAANVITSTNITNWNSAYSWGNHAGLYRPIGYVPSWSEITSNPFIITTPATDQMLKFNGTNWINFTPNFALTNHSHSNATTTTSGFMSNTDKIKLVDLQNADGSETKITAGNHIAVTGSGTTLNPYLIQFNPHYIGESYGGGIVFYVYDNGMHGLIATTADCSLGVRWYAGTNTYTMTTTGGVGSGKSNTSIIIANQGYGDGDANGTYAARICNEFEITVFGVTYGDWYLPSKYELNLLYLEQSAVGGFANANYWSSSEANDYYAWRQNFGDGSQTSALKSNATSYIRAIRAF